MKNKLPAVICLVAGLALLALHFLHFGKSSLNVTIKHADYIMPVAYKVYANPDVLNGQYYLFKMLMNNDGKTTLDDVKVSYRIQGFIDWTDLERIPKIYPGQNVVVRCYPKFKDDIVSKMTQSQEKVEIKINYNGSETINEEYNFKMMGRNQFVYTDLPPEEIASYQDLFRNTQLIACLVTPQDPIVKYYAQQVQEKVMRGEAASVDNDTTSAKNFLKGLYAATYLSHMVYSGTEGIPEKLGDVNSSVQSIRLPREVITGNTGLCIELSIFYASVMKAAGLHPVIFMVPHHAYPGVLVNGHYFAIEATGVNGEGLGGRYSPEEAYQSGLSKLYKFAESVNAGSDQYTIIDINDMEAKGIEPMELKDDDFLRKKVDDIAQSWTRSTREEPESKEEGGNNYAGGGGRSNKSSSSIRSYAGVIAFSYPATWQRYNNPFAQWPFVVSTLRSSDNSSWISVYDLSGATSASQAIQYIANKLYASGINVRYQLVNTGNGYSVYRGTSTGSNGTTEWEGAFRNSNNGIVGITIGGYNYSQKSNLFNSILSTVR